MLPTMSTATTLPYATPYRVTVNGGRTWHETWEAAKRAAGRRGFIDVLGKDMDPTIETSWVAVR